MPVHRTPLSLALAMALVLTAPALSAAPLAAVGQHQSGAPTASAQAWQQWRQGDAAAALATVDAALRTRPDADGLQLRAALLDATGDLAAARVAYAQAAEVSHGVRRWNLLVHQAVSSDDPADTLVKLDVAGESKHQSALLMAMLGRTDLAVSSAGGIGVAAQLQRAGWALELNDAASAREHAWRAFSDANDPGDRRYALALWMEAWRDEQQMERAVQWLQRQPPQPQLQQALIDALLELERYDEAIALVRGAQDPVIRQRLIGILELAGRSDEVANEYRDQISRYPRDPVAYIGLAEQELVAGRSPQALAAFEQLFAVNRGRAEVLLPAARQMTAMGMQNSALSLLRAAGLDARAGGMVDLFAFDGALARGDDAAAAELLAALHARLAAADPLQADVAVGYERLQQPSQALQVLMAMERARHQPLDYDLQVRIANLAVAAGESEQALTRWRTLWSQAQLPARRAFLERQIVKVARSRDELEPMAAALEAQQAEGTLQPAGVDLLVALTLALDAPERAEAAVARQARMRGEGRTAELLQLGGLYARLGDAERVDEVLRKLVVADPTNAGIYLRKLAVNTARRPHDGGTDPVASDAARLQELQAILQQLQAREADSGQSLQYAAGMYSMAGLDVAAASTYERALAAAPDDLDNLLQLAELRKRQHRVPEAVAMLQAAAAASNGQARFIQLADAIGGLIAVAPDERLRRGDVRASLAPATNAWIQRQLLARLATDADDYPLYAVLADLGQAQSDFSLQLRAYDNALAAAGEQRGLVLRQLVTLMSGASGMDGVAGASIGDNERKVRYGRRLLALQREFPPDFFADLGRSLLASGDALGAERAFAAMSDIGGLVNINQVKGDSYARLGHVEQALINYSQALARDQGNLDLTLKTSILLERQGEEARANYWYWHGLRALLVLQPQQDNGLVNDAALDSQRFQPALLEGLQLTWDEQDTATIAVWQDLQELFNETLARADTSAPFERQVRLRAVLAVLQQLGNYRGDLNAVGRAEDLLIERFAGDPAAKSAIDTTRAREGRGPVAAADSSGAWVLDSLFEQAQRGGNAGLALAMASSTDDYTRVQALVADAIAAETTWQALAARQPQRDPGPDTIYVLLTQGGNALPRDVFLQQVYAPVAATPYKENILFNIYRGAPHNYAALEKLIGYRLLDDTTLMRLLVEQGNQPMPFLVQRARSSEEYAESLIGTFDTGQRVALLEQFSAATQAGKGRSALQSILVRDLLRRPLTDAQRERVARVITAQIDSPADYEQGSAAFLLIPLLILDADRGNRSVLEGAASRIARRTTDGSHFPAFLQAWFDDDKPSALRELQALYSDTGDVAGNYAQPLVAKWFPEQRQQRIDTYLANPTPDAASSLAFYREFVLEASNGDAAPPPEDITRYLERLVEAEPLNEVYAAALLEDDLNHGRKARYLERLQSYVNASPGPSTAAATLVLDLYAARQDATARGVEAATDLDIEDTALMLDLVNKARAGQQRAQGPSFDRLLEGAFGRFQHDCPQATLSQTVIRQGKAAALAGPGLREGAQLDQLARAHAQAPNTVAHVLRGVWRNAPPGVRQAMMYQSYDRDGNMRDAAAPEIADAQDLLQAVVHDPGVVEELDRYLRALPAVQRQRSLRLYGLMGFGLQGAGRVPAREQELRDMLLLGTLDDHSLQLLATLLVQQNKTLDPRELQALRQRLTRMPLLAPMQRGMFAQIFAQSTANEEAIALVQASAQQLLHPDLRGGDDFDIWQRPQDGLEQLAQGLGRWPDRSAALAVWRWLDARIKEDGARPELGIKDFKNPDWL